MTKMTPSTLGPLAGVTVLESSTGYAAAMCGRLLARNGATVMRLPLAGVDSLEPVTREWLNELKPPTEWPSEPAFDVLLTDAHPREERGALDPFLLSERFPEAIVASVTPFGESGPWRDYRADALTLDALSGTLIMRGPAHRGPVSEPRYVMELAASLSAYNGILAALIRRARGIGTGEIVDVSMFEAVLHFVEQHWSNYSYQGIVAGRGGNERSLNMMACSDGYAMMMLWDDKHWQTFGALLGDDEFGTFSIARVRADPALAERARVKAAPWFAERTKVEAFQDAQDLQIPFGFAATVRDLVADPQLAARGALRNIEWRGRVFPMPDAPFALPAQRELAPTPLAEPTGPAPLSGLNVLEFSAYWAGPLAGRLLADLGADVVKVEGPSRPDPVRIQQPKDGYYTPRDKWNRGWWNGLNAGKRSLAIDLADEEGRLMFQRVIKTSDMFLENYSRRVVSNLGLDRSSLAETQPAITLVSMSAFGREGPYQDYIAFGANLEPTTGVTELVGYSDGPPEILGSIICDPIAGLAGAGAALTQLFERYHRGVSGSYIDLAQRDALLSAIPWVFGDYFDDGSVAHRNGNHVSDAAIHDCFACLGDVQFVAISCRTADEERALRRVVQAVDDTDTKHLLDSVGRWCASRTKFDAFEQLQAAGITAAPLLDVKDLDNNPHLEARAYWRTIRTGAGFRTRAMTYGFRFLKQPLRLADSAPAFGEHNIAVLERSGIAQSRILAAAERGIVTQEPTAPFPTNAVMKLS